MSDSVWMEDNFKGKPHLGKLIHYTTGRGKTSRITVNPTRDDAQVILAYEVNWSAHGATAAPPARIFLEALTLAIEMAENLNGQFVGMTEPKEKGGKPVMAAGWYKFKSGLSHAFQGDDEMSICGKAMRIKITEKVESGPMNCTTCERRLADKNRLMG